MTGERADRLLFEIVGAIDDGGLVVAAGAAHRGEHDGVKNGTGAGDAAGVPERGAIEVSDPDSDRDGACVADGPVVVVGLRRAGFDGDREGKVEIAAASEDEFAGFGITKDVGDPEGGSVGDSASCRSTDKSVCATPAGGRSGFVCGRPAGGRS